MISRSSILRGARATVVAPATGRKCFERGRGFTASVSAVLVLSGLLIGGSPDSASALVSGLSNSSIVSAATAYPDGATVGDGQCWTFMRQVVLTATGGRVAVGINNDYYGSYTAVGGELVA